jgi:hypothetical protein
MDTMFLYDSVISKIQKLKRKSTSGDIKKASNNNAYRSA